MGGRLYFASFVVVAIAAFALRQDKQKGAYKSLGAVVLDYFARPGDGGILQEPLLDARAAWRGPELKNSTQEWQTILSNDERAELAAAIKTTMAKLQAEGRTATSVTRHDVNFPPRLLALLEEHISKELSGRVDGLGVHLLRGVPVEEWTLPEQELFFLAMSRYFGTVGEQDVDGRVLQHVRYQHTSDVAEVQKRSYTTSGDILAHADPSDVVGLLCIDPGAQGGLSRIVSSVSVYNELLRRHPDMVDRLYEPFPLDLKGKQRGPSYLPIAPVRYSPGALRTFYTMDHFSSAYRHKDAPNDGVIPEYDAKVIDAYNEIVSDPNLYMDMQLEKGDVQLLSNHVVLHARTAFQDDSNKRRDLLRVWVSLPKSETLQQFVSGKVEYARLAGRIVSGMVRKVIRGTWIA